MGLHTPSCPNLGFSATEAPTLTPVPKDGAAEAVADLLLRGHVPAPSPGQWQHQPVGAVLLFHGEQVRPPPPFLQASPPAYRAYGGCCPLVVMTCNSSHALGPRCPVSQRGALGDLGLDPPPGGNVMRATGAI